MAYDFTVFAAQIAAMPASETEPTGQIANFVRVTLRNLGDRPQAAFLTSAIRYEAEQTTGQPQSDNRFRRPVPQEKVTTYAEPDDGIFLHHYLTIKNTLTELVRGEQHQAIREFYAELLHTSSSQGGFEYAIRPWGSRDFEGNIAPHGWFAADYRNLFRNMMVREEAGDLHLLSAISPEWFGPGKSIRVSQAPSYFGNIGYTLTSTAANAATLTLKPSFDHAPHAVVVHLPWFLEGLKAEANGKPVAIVDGAIRLPPDVTRLSFRWTTRTSATMSFARTVDSYEREYARRYQHLMKTGAMSPLVSFVGNV